MRMATADGITAADFITILEGGHGHFNFGFTEMGLYEVTFEAVATLADGDTVASGDVTYFFQVGQTAEDINIVRLEGANRIDQVQRSYIRHLDVLFETEDGLDDLLMNPERIRLKKFDLKRKQWSSSAAFGLCPDFV